MQQLAVPPDHCSIFLVFGDPWSCQRAEQLLHGQHIVGISKKDNPKCLLVLT